jgi:hypothetical protein
MMRPSLIRLGGLAAMVGGVLFVAAPLLGRYIPQAMPGFTMETFLVVALLLVPIGMVGFHYLQHRSYGRMGRAGFWMGVVGPLAVALGAASYLWWGSPFGSSLLWLTTIGPLLLLAGFALYGVATLQARVLPRWCGVAFIVALPIALVLSIPLSFASLFIVFGLIWLALGYALRSQRGVSAQQPSRVR